MKNQLDLNKMGVTQMNQTEIQDIVGGDTNGLMHGDCNLPYFETVVGFIKGFFDL